MFQVMSFHPASGLRALSPKPRDRFMKQPFGKLGGKLYLDRDGIFDFDYEVARDEGVRIRVAFRGPNVGQLEFSASPCPSQD